MRSIVICSGMKKLHDRILDRIFLIYFEAWDFFRLGCLVLSSREASDRFSSFLQNCIFIIDGFKRIEIRLQPTPPNFISVEAIGTDCYLFCSNLWLASFIRLLEINEGYADDFDNGSGVCEAILSFLEVVSGKKRLIEFKYFLLNSDNILSPQLVQLFCDLPDGMSCVTVNSAFLMALPQRMPKVPYFCKVVIEDIDLDDVFSGYFENAKFDTSELVLKQSLRDNSSGVVISPYFAAKVTRSRRNSASDMATAWLGRLCAGGVDEARRLVPSSISSLKIVTVTMKSNKFVMFDDLLVSIHETFPTVHTITILFDVYLLAMSNHIDKVKSYYTQTKKSIACLPEAVRVSVGCTIEGGCTSIESWHQVRQEILSLESSTSTTLRVIEDEKDVRVVYGNKTVSETKFVQFEFRLVSFD